MSAALHSVDRSRCVKPGQTRARDTACEGCYGVGCKNGYKAASRMGYVTSLQRLMDTTARCKDFPVIFFPQRSSAPVIPLSLLVTGMAINTVMGLTTGS